MKNYAQIITDYFVMVHNETSLWIQQHLNNIQWLDHALWHIASSGIRVGENWRAGAGCLGEERAARSSENHVQGEYQLAQERDCMVWINHLLDQVDKLYARTAML